MYMAGVGVETDGGLPKGFTVKEIPAATYVVFRIALNGSALHPQVKSAMATIWGELIPASGLRVVDSPDFEMYDGHFAPDQPGAVIDFYVPVEA
jgi:AraC family transcriptional regulator